MGCSCNGCPSLSHKAVLELSDYSQIDSPWKWVLPAPSVPISSHSLRNKKGKKENMTAPRHDGSLLYMCERAWLEAGTSGRVQSARDP